MNIGLILTVVALMFVILITIVYFKRGTINLFENHVYGFLLIITIIGFIINIISFIIDINYSSLLFLRTIFLKLYYGYLIFFISAMTLYILSSIKREISKRYILSFSGLTFIIFSIAMFLPLEISSDDSSYISGLSLYYVYIYMVLSIITWIILIIKNLKNKNFKKFLPFLVYIFLLIPVFYIQFNSDELLLETVLISFILVLMYHTIENPDIKLLNEIYKSKEISDNANDEKSLFIYNISQESRKTTQNINNIVNTILETDSIDDIKNYARDIINETANYSGVTYDILGMDNANTNNLKIAREKYDFKNIIKEIVLINDKICKSKNISLRVNIDKNIPDKLYGDGILLKKCLDDTIKYLINNSIGNDLYVELNISVVFKGDICRLFIVMENNNKNAKSKNLNNLINENKDILDVNNTIIKIGGAISFNANIGIGYRFKFILDQNIVVEKSLSKDFECYFENKNILIVDDNDASIKIFNKMLNDSKMNIVFVKGIKDCVDKIKNKEKYNLILIDEDINGINGKDLLIKLKKIRNFNIPCILLTKDNRNDYLDDYIKMGFDDYLLKPIKKDVLIEKLDKYLNK